MKDDSSCNSTYCRSTSTQWYYRTDGLQPKSNRQTRTWDSHITSPLISCCWFQNSPCCGVDAQWWTTTLPAISRGILWWLHSPYKKRGMAILSLYRERLKWQELHCIMHLLSIRVMLGMPVAVHWSSSPSAGHYECAEDEFASNWWRCQSLYPFHWCNLHRVHCKHAQPLLVSLGGSETCWASSCEPWYSRSDLSSSHIQVLAI